MKASALLFSSRFSVPLCAFSVYSVAKKFMNRLLPFAVLAVFAGGCARSDLGERAASEVVKAAVEGEAKSAKDSVKNIGAAKMKGGKLSGFDAKGDRVWELSANLMEVKDPGESDTPNRANFTGAKFKLFREGKLESTFDAPLIEFFRTKDGLRLAMRQGVRATNTGALGKEGVPIAVTAPRGDVDVKKRLVNLSGGAKVERGAITVTGQTLRTQTDLARSQMSGDVVAKSPQGTTKARDAIFAWKANTLAANGVTFIKDDLTLTGAKLVADTAAEKGTLSGNVRAQTPDSKANAPRVDFDWKADSIRAPRATVVREGAQMLSGALQTDSMLKVGNAQDISIVKDGSTLKAASARGFDGLSRLTGTRVTVVKDGTTLTAARAKANDWSAKAGTVEGSGGVRALNKDGSMKADNAVWSGGETGQITASGGVEIVSDGTTIRGARAVSDTQFNVATMSGDVRAQLDDGSTLSAPQVRKSGPQIVATGGTTARMKTSGDLGVLTIKAPRVDTTIGGQTARASGGVNLKSASNATATAPTATYNRARETVVASGGVLYRDPKGGTLKGKTLTANLKLQSAQMTGGVQGQASAGVFDGKSLFD